MCRRTYPTVTGTGVIHTDPQFVYDYCIADGSPCINAGDGSVPTGLSGYYAQTHTVDGAKVDLGYHRPGAFSITAPNLYVANAADGGNDGNSGTSPGDPFEHIGHALSVVEVGARIHIAAGTYDKTTYQFTHGRPCQVPNVMFTGRVGQGQGSGHNHAPVIDQFKHVRVFIAKGLAIQGTFPQPDFNLALLRGNRKPLNQD